MLHRTGGCTPILCGSSDCNKADGAYKQFVAASKLVYIRSHPKMKRAGLVILCLLSI